VTQLEPENAVPSRETVADPVCGMQVDPSDAAASREHRNVTYHFCSVSCAKKFDDDADAYIAAARLREGSEEGSAEPW
jgi:YHS domain-containing protein